uniref:adenylyl-sulfate kinase n=1 Tax=Ferrovibrio terrae TaxID=2594003 RepID=UPI00313840A5
TQRRRYVIIDAPGHKEFLKNMVTGAAQADAAILVVDAAQGLAEQTRRHAYLLHLLGIRQVAVAVNKIDLIDHDPVKFQAVADAVRNYLADIGIEVQAIVPLSARQGDNIASRSLNTAWYQGPTLIGALDAFAPRAQLTEQPLRLPIQDLYRYEDKRIVVGRIESGHLKVGDRIRFAPGGREATVATLEFWDGNVKRTPRSEAVAGESVAFTLDEDVFVERGALASTPDQRPREATRVTVRLFWLDREALKPGDRLTLKLGTAEREVEVEAITEVLDVESLNSADAKQVDRNGVARVTLRSRKPLALDLYENNARTGRGVLIRGPQIAGGFIVDFAGETTENLFPFDVGVGKPQRAQINGHRGGVLWLTGLSGAGKSTIAIATLHTLLRRGMQIYALDGDNLRSGLNRDLGFTPADRNENIRRIAEVARLMADAGLIVIVSTISPLISLREMAREIIGHDFHEIYIQADVATCQARDRKGLYARALAGEIPNFTGVSAPYEAPITPALTLDTRRTTPDAAAARFCDFIEQTFKV